MTRRAALGVRALGRGRALARLGEIRHAPARYHLPASVGLVDTIFSNGVVMRTDTAEGERRAHRRPDLHYLRPGSTHHSELEGADTVRIQTMYLEDPISHHLGDVTVAIMDSNCAMDKPSLSSEAEFRVAY